MHFSENCVLFLQQPASTAIEILDKLRKPAEEKLKKCQIDTSVPETLWLKADTVPLTLYGVVQTGLDGA